VTAVRILNHPDFTRVVVELSRSAPYETHVLADPPRLYLDIGEVWMEAPVREVQEGSEEGPVLRVRGGQNTLRRARVVLELDESTRRHRVFHLRQPDRIVTDVFRDATGDVASGPSPSFDLRPVRRIVIDPGHGGKDPGAVGPRGVREKDVVLRVARALRERLRRYGLEVFLTRDDDSYLTLEERTERANRIGADLFVSIHANSSRNRRSTGVETYLLDTRYDRQTARVAARENGTTVAKLDDLQKILASLRLGYNEAFAARVARDVHGGLVGRLRQSYRGTRDLGVKRGPFLVLFAARMPAILVEVGFVSNATEAARLRTQEFAGVAAEGIARGLLEYRDEHERRLLAGR
jgi:N-acetylmuramoyl-L-alanine amidase